MAFTTVATFRDLPAFRGIWPPTKIAMVNGLDGPEKERILSIEIDHLRIEIDDLPIGNSELDRNLLVYISNCQVKHAKSGS